MQAIGRQPQKARDGAPVHYERHRPEQTTLYRLVQQHAATFFARAEAEPVPICPASLPRGVRNAYARAHRRAKHGIRRGRRPDHRRRCIGRRVRVEHWPRRACGSSALSRATGWRPTDYPEHGDDWELARTRRIRLSPNLRGRRRRLPVNDADSPIAAAMFNAVGGSTIFFAAHFPRFHPVRLQGADDRRRRRGLAARLPQLEPWYALELRA